MRGLGGKGVQDGEGMEEQHPGGRRSVLRPALHLAVVGIALLWMTPTAGLLVSSFRDGATTPSRLDAWS